MAKLVGAVFSGLSALSIEEVEDAGDVIVVRASTRGDEVACPACGALTGRVHAFHERIPADVPIDGRRVRVRLRIRRMRCPVTECARKTFREQVPGLIERYQRRTVRLGECWATATGLREGKLAETTLQRWQQIHALLEAGVGLLDCSRRLGLALNTVKRYARATTPQRIQRVPKYRTCMVDPYRDHLRARREQEPSVGATVLLAEIRALGYTGSHNLLVRYLNQGRHLDDHPHLSPRRAARLLLTRPENLTERQRERLEGLAAACPEMTALTGVVRSFAALLTPHKDNPAQQTAWITAARETDLPHVHSFARGIAQDTDAVIAAVTLTHHNGRTEGVNTKTKLLKRQMYGRAGITLLRHRILLG